uniref:Uncharacterized protein n=1 Tax=Romanomermis culicivorax TaxID=13658 RepID=A0A915JVP5_ROMCU
MSQIVAASVIAFFLIIACESRRAFGSGSGGFMSIRVGDEETDGQEQDNNDGEETKENCELMNL